ncbi:FERM domain-containing protein 5 [Homalodisca vitripennis]|nr:FERM domain-containing protein 5 [Homalodisca vitripennis]
MFPHPPYSPGPCDYHISGNEDLDDNECDYLVEVSAVHKDSDSSVGGFGDYYFRDSMDHSSSESQLLGTSHRSSRSQTPVLRGGRIPLPPTTTARPPAPGPSPAPHTATRTFNLLRVFIPSFLIAAFSLVIVIIFVLETDYEILGSLRRAPEMITLRRLYYEPTKEFFRLKFSSGAKGNT